MPVTAASFFGNELASQLGFNNDSLKPDMTLASSPVQSTGKIRKRRHASPGFYHSSTDPPGMEIKGRFDPSALAAAAICPEPLPKKPNWTGLHGHSIGNTEDDTSMEGIDTAQRGIQLGDIRMVHIIPTVMSFLCKHDLAKLMTVNRAFYEEGKRLLYREVIWDLYDDTTNAMIMRFINCKKNRPSTSNFFTVPLAKYVQQLYVHVAVPSCVTSSYETSFRMGLLKLALPRLTELRKLSIADCRRVKSFGPEQHLSISPIAQISMIMEEIIWGKGTQKLETLEIVIQGDLGFFTSLMRSSIGGQGHIHLDAPLAWRDGISRPTSIKHLTIKDNSPTHAQGNFITEFQFQMAYLLSVLSSSLTSLVLIGLPKPHYLAGARDVGTGTWGGSVGSILEILGPHELYNLEELTIEGADTRYEAAEGPILAWLTERSIYVQPTPDDETQRKLLLAEESQIVGKVEKLSSNQTFTTAATPKECRHLLSLLQPNGHGIDSDLHLNCNETCSIHGTTSGTFTIEKNKQKRFQLHPNPLLRKQQAPRKFAKLHFINCSEPWPAFYAIACLHPLTTLHFSSPWMDASSTDVPLPLLKLGVPKYGFGPTLETRKRIGKPPSWPLFNTVSFTTGAEYGSNGSTAFEASNSRTRPSGTSKLNFRKLRKKLNAYISILENITVVPPDYETRPNSPSPTFAQIARFSTKRVEIRCLDRVSMSLLKYVIECFGGGVEIIGISRLDGCDLEESVKGHVRGWGKILRKAEKLQELRIVWNLFDPLDRREEEKWPRPMKVGIGEHRRGGEEVVLGFTEDEWWGDNKLISEAQPEVTQVEVEDLGNGEGPSTGTAHVHTQSAANPEQPMKTATPKVYSPPDKLGRMWQKTVTELPLYRNYLAHSSMPISQRDIVSKDEPQWQHEQRKDLLCLLLNWKLKALYQSRVELFHGIPGKVTHDPPIFPILPPIFNFHLKMPATSNVFQDTGKLRDPFSSSTGIFNTGSGSSGSGIRGRPFYVPQSQQLHSRSNATPHFPFPSASRAISQISGVEEHNARIYMSLVRAGYLNREKIVAEAIWKLIDQVPSEGGHASQKAEFKKQFVISEDVHPGDYFRYSPGIVFMAPNHSSYTPDSEPDYGVGIRGPWGKAFMELSLEKPELFRMKPSAMAGFEPSHAMYVEQLRVFFEQINVWHEQFRVEELLGFGVKRFCESAWVIFQEVKSLKRIVGVLENGREVVAHVIRSSGSNLPYGGVEMIKLRCWACGGGWSGDSNVGDNGDEIRGKKVYFGGNARECRCVF
ncbi:hypothetical protein DFH27DRAFT_120527 [Peziza echinospora]|nr:hypothetical protein DFH27DRAFT_120527 [Peziza echinospora]